MKEIFTENLDKYTRTIENGMRKVLLAAGILGIGLGMQTSAEAAKGTLVYVPMDNRPVCLDYTVQTMEAAGWEVKTPPAEYIASDTNMGNPDELLDWVEQNAQDSLAVVASSDALLYGGLVASRTHDLDSEIVRARVNRLLKLKNEHRGQKVFVFTTIMRSPKMSAAPVEPAYYAEWGPKLFRMGALEDKLDLKKIKRKEVKELANLRAEIPQHIKDDLYLRRANNIRSTELLLHGVESGDFDYMLIGRDDTAEFSQAHREARNMDILVSELPKERIRFFAGADQLGLLLLTRAANRLQYELPLVNTTYAAGVAGDTVPSYEDDKVSVSAKQHILASGGFPAKLRKNAELVLAINTPYDGKTLEAGNAANTYTADRMTTNFVHKIDRIMNAGHKVAIADVKYGNGADNALVKALFDNGLAYRLSAYNGWNTAGNSLGYTLSQGILSKTIGEEDKMDLLNERYLDDWAYQANVRNLTYTQLIWPKYWPNSGLNDEQKTAAQDYITQHITELAAPYMGDAINNYEFTLPWNRMFEVKVAPKSEEMSTAEEAEIDAAVEQQ